MSIFEFMPEWLVIMASCNLKLVFGFLYGSIELCLTKIGEEMIKIRK